MPGGWVQTTKAVAAQVHNANKLYLSLFSLSSVVSFVLVFFHAFLSVLGTLNILRGRWVQSTNVAAAQVNIANKCEMLLFSLSFILSFLVVLCFFFSLFVIFRQLEYHNS